MYDNIQAVLGQNKLTPQEQSENYEIFDKMMKSGVSLQGLLNKVADLEKKVNILTSKPAVNEELFSVMEQAVRKCPEVMEARQVMERAMKTVLTEMCMKDPRFAKPAECYRTAVNKAYIERSEKAEKFETKETETPTTSYKNKSSES